MKIRLHSRKVHKLRRALLVAHRATMLAGACLLGWPLLVTAQSAWTQWTATRELAQARAQETIVVPAPGAPRVKPEFSRGVVLGQFEIPRLGLSYALLEGTDNRTLDRSIGHIEGTGHIGSTGNIGIAGHRNTHFRKLEWIRRDDEIVLTSRTGGAHHYRVEWARLFHPDDVQVLDPGQGPAVTLVTCYPFEYVGAAPLRFIVRALPAD